MHFNERSTRKMNQLFAALVSLWIGYKRKKKLRRKKFLKSITLCLQKMKYRWYSYIYMHEINHYEKKLFQHVNNTDFQ